MMKGGLVMVWLVMVVVLGMLRCGWCRDPVLHRVGGSKSDGWREQYNYTEWSIHERFYVGDWLYFGFNKHLYTVFEVNKTSYDNCDDRNFIKNITRGGRDVFNLTESKTYYFLSSGGYCWHGMKLEVHVVDFNDYADLAAPAPSENGCLSKISGSFITLAIAFTISILSVTYFNLNVLGV